MRAKMIALNTRLRPVSNGCVTQAEGYAERDAAANMPGAIKTDGPISLGAD
jgi:hypothetical protein